MPPSTTAKAGLGELVALPRAGAGSAPAWHLFVVSHPEVKRVEAALAAAAIGHRAYYRTPVHRQPAMRPWAPGVELPGTELAAARHLAVPISPVLSRAQTDEVLAAVQAAFA